MSTATNAWRDQAAGSVARRSCRRVLFAAGEPSTAITFHRPAGPLGPRYRVTFQVMVGVKETKPLRQEIYPFARAGFVVHTPPGQRVFDRKARSGWYVSEKLSDYGGMESDGATALLVAAGVPNHDRAK